MLDRRLQLLMQAEVTVIYHQYPFQTLHTPIGDRSREMRDTKGSVEVDYSMVHMLGAIFLLRCRAEYFERKPSFAQTGQAINTGNPARLDQLTAQTSDILICFITRYEWKALVLCALTPVFPGLHPRHERPLTPEAHRDNRRKIPVGPRLNPGGVVDVQISRCSIGFPRRADCFPHFYKAPRNLPLI